MPATTYAGDPDAPTGDGTGRAGFFREGIRRSFLVESPAVTIPPGSFGFRLTCYEKFGWSPAHLKELSFPESQRLSIYFEEEAAYHAKQRREQSAPVSQTHDVVEFSLPDEDDE